MSDSNNDENIGHWAEFYTAPRKEDEDDKPKDTNTNTKNNDGTPTLTKITEDDEGNRWSRTATIE